MPVDREIGRAGQWRLCSGIFFGVWANYVYMLHLEAPELNMAGRPVI